MMNEKIYDVLLAEEDRDLAAALRRALERKGYRLKIASDGVRALVLADEYRFGCALVDEKLSRIGSDEVIRELGKKDMPVVCLSESAFAPAKTSPVGAAAYLARPFDENQLFAALNKAGAYDND